MQRHREEMAACELRKGGLEQTDTSLTAFRSKELCQQTDLGLQNDKKINFYRLSSLVFGTLLWQP
jgi:uncharacterized protein YpiB (UPF0302 family)